MNAEIEREREEPDEKAEPMRAWMPWDGRMSLNLFGIFRRFVLIL